VKIVERGGQSVLAAVSWSVFRQYVTTAMESAPITYSSFRGIFLDAGPSLLSTCRLFRDFAFRKGFYSRIATIFMLATMTFTLAFPTLASAMTGYNGRLKAYVPDHVDANYIRFDKFESVLYVIRDGDRVGLPQDFLVTDVGYGMSGSEVENVLIRI
jgi:hypothetical protein